MTPQIGSHPVSSAYPPASAAILNNALITRRFWRAIAAACCIVGGLGFFATPGEAAGLPARITSPPTVGVGSGPDGLAFDASTHTLYTVNQNSNSVSVVNTAHCSAGVTTSCLQHVTSVPLGTLVNPEGVALDTATHTLYVAENGAGISVIDTATCNALDQTGCAAPLALVGDDAGPLALAVNQSTDTVYVANFGPKLIGTGDTVSVLDGATCNSADTSGCSQVPASITVNQAPDGVAVDPRTDTVYVVNGGGIGQGNTVSVIDGTTCGSTQTSGCGQQPRTITVGHGPQWIALDLQNDTAYTANMTDSDVSVIDIAKCNAVTGSGCGQRTGQVPVGSSPWALAIDPAHHTVYVADNKDQTLSVINTATCNGTVRSSCSMHQPTTQVGNGGQAVVVDPTTHTVFTANFLDDTVSVVNGDHCSAADTAGCRHQAPVARVGSDPDGLAIDRATHTLYVANQASDSVSVIDTTGCSASKSTGCGHPKATINVGNGPTGVAVDEVTHTVYVTNNGGSTVSVIDGATCNAEDQSGCRTPPGSVAAGDAPFAIALDQTTDTAYVTDLGTKDDGDTVSVIDGATCNATVRSGCGQTPPEVTVGSGPFGIAVNPTTDTVYVADTGQLFVTADGNTVSVIDGATCNAEQSSGCGQVPAAVTVGRAPFGVAVDQSSNTVYVANNGGGEIDATLSAIDGTHCDAADMSGCSSPPPTSLGSGRAPNGIALDPRTHTLYTADFWSAAVSVIDLAGPVVGRKAPRFAVGAAPEAVVFDSANGTVYVSSSLDGTVSVLPGAGVSRG